jgi:hypothetical protein
MTGEPITPWAEYHRAQWAPFADPLRPFGTDEEPWLPADPGPQHGLSLLDGAVVGVAWWVYLTGAVSAALAVVLLLLGIRAVRHPGGTR